MKMLTKFLLCVGALALTSAPSTVWAATCADGATLATFLAGGANSTCTIGDKTFSNFTYTSAAAGTAVVIPASGITVDTIGPLGTGASLIGPDIGLEFVSVWSVGPASTLDSNIKFQVAVTGGGPLLIKDVGLAQGGSSFSGSGIAQVAENACGPAPCTPSGAINLLTIDSAFLIKLTDSTTFTPNGSLSVVKDISVAGGTNGSASISDVDDTFSQTAVPIPGALPLFATGLVGLWGLRRKRQSSRAASAA